MNNGNNTHEESNGRKSDQPKRPGYVNVRLSDDYKQRISTAQDRGNFTTQQETLSRLINVGLLVSEAQAKDIKLFLEDAEGNRMRVFLI